MDNFHEQFVGRKDSKVYNSIRYSMYAAAVIAIAFFAILKIIGFIIFALITGAIFVAKKKLYVEYEYSFTNGEIDIDKIIDKSNRKSVANFYIKNIEIMAKADSDLIKHSGFNYKKEFNFYNKHNDDIIYSVLLVCNEEKLRINFVPDKEFLELCFSMNPRKVNKLS